MAKAVVPLRAFRDKFGSPEPDEVNERIVELMIHFLHEHQAADKRREVVKA
jgi:hypothetical protein